MRNAVLISILLAGLLYGIGSFIAGGWHPTHDWSAPGRAFFAFLWVVASAVLRLEAAEK